MADLTKLDKAIDELEVQSQNLKEFNKAYSEIVGVKSDISSSLKLMKDNNQGFESISSKIIEQLENSKNQLEKIDNDLMKKIQEIYQDNKNFQKELDSNLNSKLEKNKSDIQVEIRNEGRQTQKVFENTLTEKFNKMEANLAEQSSIQIQQLKSLKVYAIVILTLIVISSLALFFFLR